MAVATKAAVAGGAGLVLVVVIVVIVVVLLQLQKQTPGPYWSENRTINMCSATTTGNEAPPP